jgi:hypothetical protein
MSELKAFDITVAEEGYFEGIVKYRRAVYDKSEADKVIAEKDAEIARLKAIRKVHVEAIESMGAGLHQDEKEICRLRRALYKACANWADAEVFERTVGIDDPNVEANRWAVMRNKCLKKAEEWM